MALVIQNYQLDLTPGISAPVIIHCSQKDDQLRQIVFSMIYNKVEYSIPSNTKVLVQGVRRDGIVFSYVLSFSGSRVTVPITETMVETYGTVACEIILISSTEERLGTATFILEVERAPFENNVFAETSDAQTFADYLNTAKYYKSLSQSWAVGRTGIRSDENTDNSKYYSDLSKLYRSSPLIARVQSDMQDINHVYVYVGNDTETFVYGNWYYFDGDSWVSGGIYNSNGVNTDKLLIVEDVPADGKATGEAIETTKAELEDRIDNSIDSSIGPIAEKVDTLKAKLPDEVYFKYLKTEGSLDNGFKIISKNVTDEHKIFAYGIGAASSSIIAVIYYRASTGVLTCQSLGNITITVNADPGDALVLEVHTGVWTRLIIIDDCDFDWTSYLF